MMVMQQQSEQHSAKHFHKAAAAAEDDDEGYNPKYAQESDEAKEKRKRQAAACDACRQRKRGCDGKVPCNQCTRKNIPCTFIMERRRQTRKTLEKTDAAAAQGHMVAAHLTSAGAKARNAAANDPPQMPQIDTANMSILEQQQLYQQQLTVTGNVALVHSDFMVASHTAVMIDLFFEHYTCVFGCICRESLMNPKTRSAEFLQHAVLAVVNRSFGDAAAKTHHEQEARRIAALVGDENVDETVQAFLVLSFFYGSENVLLAAQFARMAETALQDAERRMGRTPSLMKLRGLCRSMRCTTDVRALLDQKYHLPNFVAGQTPDDSDPCIIHHVLMAVLAELLRADQELVHTFYSSNPFQSWIKPAHLAKDKADNLVAATQYAHKELHGETFACLPSSARWGIVVTMHCLQALSLYMSGRQEESLQVVADALRFSRPSASQFLSAKPMVVPFLAGLALLADAGGRHDLLLDISNLLLRLGRIFRSAWLGYNEVVARLPVGMAMPNPAPVPHQTFSTANAPKSLMTPVISSSSSSSSSSAAAAPSISISKPAIPSSSSTSSSYQHPSPAPTASSPHTPMMTSTSASAQRTGSGGSATSSSSTSTMHMEIAGAAGAAAAAQAAQAAAQHHQSQILASDANYQMQLKFHNAIYEAQGADYYQQNPLAPSSFNGGGGASTGARSMFEEGGSSSAGRSVGQSDVSQASTPMYLQDAASSSRRDLDDEDDGIVDYEEDSDDEGVLGALDAILPQSTLNADAAAMLAADRTERSKVCDPWIAGMSTWDDQAAPADWRDFWLLNQSLAQ